jgi:hypothetical protein
MSDADLVFYVTLTVKPERIEDWKAAALENDRANRRC